MTFGRLNVLGSLGKLYGGGAGGGAFSWANAEGAAFEAQADGTGWDDALRGDIDQLISDLKSGQVNGSNTYSGFDRILLMDLPNQPDSLRYLNAPTLTATAVNSPAFMATEGFTGDASTAYIDTGYNPAQDGVQYTQDNASAAIWIRTPSTGSNQAYIGGSDSSYNNALMFGGAIYVNASGTASTVVSPAFSAGLAALDRPTRSQQLAYKNGSLAVTGNRSSADVPDKSLAVLAYATSGSINNESDGQVSVFFAGRSFTANEWADIYDAFNRYRTAREAA